MKLRNLPTLLFSVFLVILGLACRQQSRPDLAKEDIYDIGNDSWGAGFTFLWAVAYDDEQLAMSVLSTRTQAAVAGYCEKGKVTACFNDVWLPEWGEIKHVTGDPSYSHGLTFTYRINNRLDEIAIVIVLEIINENGQWRVDSWRGLIPYDDEVINGLVDGTDTTNLFPPDLRSDIETVQPTTAAPTQESLSPTPTSTPEPTPTETPTVQPSPTPVCSGNRLMFNMVVNGIEKAPVDGLYIACSDGSYIYQFTNTSSSLPSISPDGKRMALATTYYDYKSTEVLEIVDMSDWSEIFKIENITPGGAIWSMSWSPDSEYVLYRRSLLDYDYDDAIEVIHVDSGTVSRVLYQDEIYHTAWSPDGQRVAYSKIGLTIYTMGIECDDSTHRCKQTDDPRLIFSGGDQPSWSPDGTQIVAVCPKLGSLHETLCLMDVEGNLIQEFDHGLWFITGPVWSPDGSMIAFCAKYAEGGGNDMYILSVDDASLTNLTADSDLLVGLPMWLPDERTNR